MGSGPPIKLSCSWLAAAATKVSKPSRWTRQKIIVDLTFHSYNDSQTIHPAYSHQSTLDTSPMSQQTQWYGANYPNYQQVSTPAPVFYNTTPTTTSDYNYSQPTANTSMMGYQGHVGEEYPEGDEYPDPNENCPTPEDE
jgi:hypothetical protein